MLGIALLVLWPSWLSSAVIGSLVALGPVWHFVVFPGISESLWNTQYSALDQKDFLLLRYAV